MSFYTVLKDQSGIRLCLRVEPKSKKDAVIGLMPTREAVAAHGREEITEQLKITLQAPPADFAANEALIRFLAGIFRVPQNDLTLKSGKTGRNKTVEIKGPVEILLKTAALYSGNKNQEN